MEACGLFALHVTLCEDGVWRASLETADQYDEAEPNIAAMLAAVESLAGEPADQWHRCAVREFNSGFESLPESPPFIQAFSPRLLQRIAAVGASLAFTVYGAAADDGPPFLPAEARPQVH